MQIEFIWFIGFIASIFITISILPQTYKMCQMRKEKLEEFHMFWFIFGIIGR